MLQERIRSSDRSRLRRQRPIAANREEVYPGSTERTASANDDHPRVQASGFLRVSEASLKRHLGSGYELRQLEAIMAAFAGRIKTTSDEITWQLKVRDGTAAAAH